MKINRGFATFGMVALMIMALATGLAVDAGAYEMKSNRENRVRVDVKPVQLAPGQPAKFEVRMNTHSVTLSHDLISASKLIDSQGHEYQPTKWQGSPPGGHHRQGVLEFPALNSTSKSITLVIRHIDNVPERIFEWPIEK